MAGVRYNPDRSRTSHRDRVGGRHRRSITAPASPAQHAAPAILDLPRPAGWGPPPQKPRGSVRFLFLIAAVTLSMILALVIVTGVVVVLLGVSVGY